MGAPPPGPPVFAVDASRSYRAVRQVRSAMGIYLIVPLLSLADALVVAVVASAAHAYS
jgi:hypothetical protein